jgi:hypothetical protein
MLFITYYRIRPGMRDAAIARFGKGGAMPPAGVKLLGRWHDVGNGAGVTVAEAPDASLMARFAFEWNDLMELDTHPALNDEQLGAVLAGMQTK